MSQNIAHVAILVEDYDQAIEYYTKKLNFDLIEDTDLGNEKRWVLVAPEGASGTSLLLARAVNSQQEFFIGNQSGNRVFLFLQTTDFWNDYEKMKSKGVNFIEDPREEPYGLVVVFKDIYGNKWDFLQYVDRNTNDKTGL